MGYNGLHNILEPAVFSIPVLIGKNFKGFVEAEDLTSLDGLYSVNNPDEFFKYFTKLTDSKELRSKSGEINYSYIKKNVQKNRMFIDSLIKKIEYL